MKPKAILICVGVVFVLGVGLYVYERNHTKLIPISSLSGVATTTQSTAAVTSSTTPPVSTPKMSKYTDADFGFSFLYPIGWKVVKDQTTLRLINPNDPKITRYYDGTWVTFTEYPSNTINETSTMNGVATYLYNPTTSQLFISGEVATPIFTSAGGFKVYAGQAGYGEVIVPIGNLKLLSIESSNGVDSFPQTVAKTITR